MNAGIHLFFLLSITEYSKVVGFQSFLVANGVRERTEWPAPLRASLLLSKNKAQNEDELTQANRDIPPMVTNPLTRRKIRVGGPKYNDFMNEGGWILHEGTLCRLDLEALRKFQQGKTASEPITNVKKESTLTPDWYRITPSIVSETNKLLDPADEGLLNEHLLFVNKPSGLNCVPARDPSVDSLSARVSCTYKNAKPCHRLDRNTSGIVVFGLSPDTHRNVSQQFEARTTSKTYVALVAGHPQQSHGIIDFPIGKILTPEGYNRWTIGGSKPRSAVTEWHVLETFSLDGCKFARVHLTPKTGRGHQLRLHCKAMGNPILGDALHGEGGVATCSPRLCLHAQVLQVDWNGIRIQATSISPF